MKKNIFLITKKINIVFEERIHHIKFDLKKIILYLTIINSTNQYILGHNIRLNIKDSWRLYKKLYSK